MTNGEALVKKIRSYTWPKLLFSGLIFFNGLLIACAGIISALLVEKPNIGKLIQATWMANLAIIVIIGVPMGIAFLILSLYCIITSKVKFYKNNYENSEERE